MSHELRVLLTLWSAVFATSCAREPEPPPASLPATAGCTEGGVGPATAAPAVGLWADRRAEGSVRVTARIGPARVGGTPQSVSHPVETIETRPGEDTVRASRGDAIVRLDLLPPYGGDLSSIDSGSLAPLDSHPAATYTASAGVVLASYESCSANAPEPLVRYLRRETDGRIVTDVMLHRRSVGP